mgnify:CR=1 FL=1
MCTEVILSTAQAKQIAYDWYDIIVKTITEEGEIENEKKETNVL